MTIKVVGVWELGWNTPIKELDLWEYPLCEYGVDHVHMSPISGIRSDFVTEHHDLSLFLDSERELKNPIIFADERGTEILDDFVHPENAVYVFGKGSFRPMVSYFKPGDISVRIVTPRNSGLLWPHQAATILLHDRYLKAK